MSSGFPLCVGCNSAHQAEIDIWSTHSESPSYLVWVGSRQTQKIWRGLATVVLHVNRCDENVREDWVPAMAAIETQCQEELISARGRGRASQGDLAIFAHTRREEREMKHCENL